MWVVGEACVPPRSSLPRCTVRRTSSTRTPTAPPAGSRRRNHPRRNVSRKSTALGSSPSAPPSVGDGPLAPCDRRREVDGDVAQHRARQPSVDHRALRLLVLGLRRQPHHEVIEATLRRGTRYSKPGSNTIGVGSGSAGDRAHDQLRFGRDEGDRERIESVTISIGSPRGPPHGMGGNPAAPLSCSTAPRPPPRDCPDRLRSECGQAPAGLPGSASGRSPARRATRTRLGPLAGERPRARATVAVGFGLWKATASR